MILNSIFGNIVFSKPLSSVHEDMLKNQYEKDLFHWIAAKSSQFFS